MKEFTSTARKDGRWWVVQCDQEPAALSQVARLDQAAEHQREAIAFVTGLDEDDISVEVKPALPEEITDLLAMADLHRYEAETYARQAFGEIRAAAAQLADQDYSLRDIGAILEVSHQRAHQLVQEYHELVTGFFVGDDVEAEARARARKAPPKKRPAQKAPARRRLRA